MFIFYSKVFVDGTQDGS